MPHKDPEQRREYHREYNRMWNQERRERRLEINREADQRRYDTPKRQRQLAEVRQRRHIRQRVAVLDRYGGACSFCGTTQYEHLTVDHINGGGTKHRAEFRTKYRGLYDFLYNTEFRPDLYRILCWNCHMAMTRYGVMPGGEPLHDMVWWRKFGALRRAPNSDSKAR